jgi:hypothetical protein
MEKIMSTIIQDALFEIDKDVYAVIEQILADAPHQMTFYQLAKYLNSSLYQLEVTKNGSPYQVRPQMMYNYASSGMIVKGDKNAKSVTRLQAYEFICRFINKLI